MGVKTLEEIPSNEDLGSPERRGCHGCMEHVSEVWVTCTHDDLTFWSHPFCRNCWRLAQRYMFRGDSPVDQGLTTQQCAFLDRVEQWCENFDRWDSQRRSTAG